MNRFNFLTSENPENVVETAISLIEMDWEQLPATEKDANECLLLDLEKKTFFFLNESDMQRARDLVKSVHKKPISYLTTKQIQKWQQAKKQTNKQQQL